MRPYSRAVTSKTDVDGGRDNLGPVLRQSVFHIYIYIYVCAYFKHLWNVKMSKKSLLKLENLSPCRKISIFVSTYGESFWWGNLREKDHSEDPRVDGRIILR